jgi:anti-sigma B factor antagonist
MIEKTLASDQCVLTLRGRLNAASAPELKHRLRDLAASGRTRIVLDMAAVDFIDSSGLSAMIAGLKATREVGGYLRLAGLKDQAATVLKLTMLDRVFELHPDVESAFRA